MNGFTRNGWIKYVNLIRALNAFLSVLGRSTEDRIAKDRKLEVSSGPGSRHKFANKLYIQIGSGLLSPCLAGN